MNQTLAKPCQRARQIGTLYVVPGRLRQQCGRAQEKDSHSGERRSFPRAEDNPSRPIESLEEEQFFRAMKQPTGQVEQKIHDEENGHERYAFQQQRRHAPMPRHDRGDLLIIGDRDHEPGDEGGKGKQLPEKTSKKAAQAEQGDDTEKNQIHPVHGRKPFRTTRVVMQPKFVKATRPVKDFALCRNARLRRISPYNQSKPARRSRSIWIILLEVP